VNRAIIDLLQKHFDTALETPDGIKKLRGLILTLAMQGKLVKQDPADQPASELLKQIAAEKARLIQEGKIKKQEPLPPIKPEEIPYGLPKDWKWVMLGDISARIHYGFTASADSSIKDTRLLRITDIQENKVEWESVPGCIISEKEVDQYRLSHNDILIARTGGTVGKSYLVENPSVRAVFASYLIRVIPSEKILVRYLKFCIESPLYWKQLHAKCSGTGQPNVNGTSLSTLLLTLPPLAEQRRIVEKINQLMGLCDTLEKLRDERNKKRVAVHAAAVNGLFNGRGKTAFDDSWRFLTRHFDELYSVPENVTELRKAILQLAVMGKLVPQDPTDQPASELLKEIEVEKKRLAKIGEIRNEKMLPFLEESLFPFGLPRGWCWCRLGELSKLITSGSRDWAEHYSDTGPIFLRMGNLSRGSHQLRMEKIQRVIPPKDSEGARTKLDSGDVLISITGEVGLLGLIPPDFGEAYINQHTCLVRLMPKLQNRFIPEFFLSPFAQAQFNAPQRGIKNSFRLSDVSSLLTPLPPLPEQRRIVAKIDKLMALCENMERKIVSAAEKQNTVLNAVLAKV
jgi:type I restriction enzyme S subunit